MINFLKGLTNIYHINIYIYIYILILIYSFIFYIKEYHNSSSNHRDKFLILWTQVDDKVRANELNDFWKQVTGSKANINEHK